MRSYYDFSKLKGRRNPYAKLLKKAITIRLDPATIEYFKALAASTGIPYQSLINLYLGECAARGKKLSMQWSLPAGEVREAKRVYRSRRKGGHPKARRQSARVLSVPRK